MPCSPFTISETDRVPVDFSARSEVNSCPHPAIGHPDYDALLEYLGVDFRYVQPIEVITTASGIKGRPLPTGEAGSGKTSGACGASAFSSPPAL